MFPRILIAFVFLLAARAAHAQGGLTPDGHLDTASLRDAYLQSDIPMVRGTLEGFMKSHPKEVDRTERIFTHLYLGAIYAGEQTGRALGVGHFRSLLKIDPMHDPAAMYFTPQTKAIFEEAKAGLARETAPAPVPALDGAPSGNGTPQAAPASRSAAPAAIPPAVAAPEAAALPAVAVREADRAWIWWTVGSAVAAVGAGVGVYALVASNSDPGPRKVDVDATLK